jgi:C-terminal processing protease CtpA/Prc
MFNGQGLVENVMTGSPAYFSRNILKGDIIVKVDGEFVQGSDLQKKIVGDDTPGSMVTLTVKRGPADLVDVTLKRISTEEVADKRRMFDLFTKLNDRVRALVISHYVNGLLCH